MNYVPSVGIGYTPAGQPRPTVSFSLSQIFTAQRQRSATAAARPSASASGAIAATDAHNRLDELLGKLELMNLEFETMEKVHEIDVSMYELSVLDYEAAKLAPSAFLPKKKAYLESELNLTRKKIEIRNFEAAILTFCHAR